MSLFNFLEGTVLVIHPDCDGILSTSRKCSIKAPAWWRSAFNSNVATYYAKIHIQDLALVEPDIEFIGIRLSHCSKMTHEN